MLLGARQFFERRGAPTPSVLTARDYVQNGLVAMWDGIENAGWGTHNTAATTWKDLVGNRDWTLGTSTSYEWTVNSFDAKDQFAATQDFISGDLVQTVEVCASIKSQGATPRGNYAFIMLGRDEAAFGPYYGLLYRNPIAQEFALMCERSYFTNTYTEFVGKGASFSFPNFHTVSVNAFFNGITRTASASNTLDYNATTRGTVARIGGTALQSMPIEVYNIRLYSRVLTADEIAANYAIDKARFNLP